MSNFSGKFLILLILSIICYLGLFKINEYDVFHHLAAGKYIIENKEIPNKLLFSHSFGALKANDSEWLFQIILWVVHQLIGINGLIIFKAIFFAFLYFLLFLIALEGNANIYITAIVFLLGGLIARLRFYHRPEMMMYLFNALVILLLQKYLKERSKSVFFIPIIFMFWANMHPTIIIGLFIISAFVAEQFFFIFIRYLRKEKFDLSNLKNLLLILLISISFSLVNPLTISPLVEPLKLSKTRVLMGLVSELQPLQVKGIKSIISNDISFILFLFFTVGFLSFLLNFKRASLAYFIIFAGLAYLATQALRNVSLFIQVASPIISINLSSIIRLIGGEPAARVSPVAIPRGARVILRGARVIKGKGAGWLLVLISATYALLTGYGDNADYLFGLGMNEFLIPVKAVDFLIENKISGRMFNTFHFGGYLEYRLYPKEMVLIDGRGFGNEELLREYVMSQANQNLWENYQNKYNLDYAIVGYPELKNIPKIHSDIRDYSNEEIKSLSIPDNNWVLIYWDDTAMIYLKRIKKFKKIIDRYEVKYYKPDLPLEMLKIYLRDPLKLEPLLIEIKRNASSYRGNLAMGYIFNEKGEYYKAANAYAKAISMRADNDAAYAGLGYAYYKLGEIKKAEQYYKKAIKLNNADAMHHYNLGLIYIQIGEKTKAISEMEKAIQINKNFAEAYKKLMQLYLGEGNFGKYNEIYMKIKMIEKENFLKGKFNRALKLYSENKLNEALKEYEEILQYDQRDPAILNNIGFIYYDLKDYKKAIEYHKRCIESDFNFENGHYGLALAYEKLGEKAKAIEEWEKYLQLKPKGIWALKAEQHLKALKKEVE